MLRGDAVECAHLDAVRLYVAGHWGSRFRLRPEVERLRAGGNDVHSSWVDKDTEGDPAIEARRDLEEIRWAEALILDTLDDDTTGGREFEAGFAHGIWRPVYLVGPCRSVFHQLARNQWATWEDAHQSGCFGDPNRPR